MATRRESHWRVLSEREYGLACDGLGLVLLGRNLPRTGSLVEPAARARRNLNELETHSKSNEPCQCRPGRILPQLPLRLLIFVSVLSLWFLWTSGGSPPPPPPPRTVLNPAG
jgi:hypothetical protein